MSEDSYKCPSCGGQNWGNFVHYGSFLLTCLSCKEDGPATSFIAIGPQLKRRFQAVEVNDDLSEKALLVEGEGQEIFELVWKEAGKGKRIWLKSL